MAEQLGTTGLENKVFPTRHKWALPITIATCVAMAICVIGFGVANSVTINASDFTSLSISVSGACAVQSAFGIFVVVMIVEMMIMAVVWISICCSAKSDRYRVNIVGHASCLLGVMVACIIYGVKQKENIGWYFWFAVISMFLLSANVALWAVTQYVRRRDKLMQVKLEAVTGAGMQAGY